MPEPHRCSWAEGQDSDYVRYHDEEWGRAVHDDRHLFEMLTLEGAQAGLSWATILRKRAAFSRPIFQKRAQLARRWAEVFLQACALPTSTRTLKSR